MIDFKDMWTLLSGLVEWGEESSLVLGQSKLKIGRKKKVVTYIEERIVSMTGCRLCVPGDG